MFEPWQNPFEKPLLKVAAYPVLNTQWYLKSTNKNILVRQHLAIIFNWSKKLSTLDNGKHDEVKIALKYKEAYKRRRVIRARTALVML